MLEQFWTTEIARLAAQLIDGSLLLVKVFIPPPLKKTWLSWACRALIIGLQSPYCWPDHTDKIRQTDSKRDKNRVWHLAKSCLLSPGSPNRKQSAQVRGIQNTRQVILVRSKQYSLNHKKHTRKLADHWHCVWDNLAQKEREIQLVQEEGEVTGRKCRKLQNCRQLDRKWGNKMYTIKQGRHKQITKTCKLIQRQTN